MSYANKKMYFIIRHKMMVKYFENKKHNTFITLDFVSVIYKQTIDEILGL